MVKKKVDVKEHKPLKTLRATSNIPSYPKVSFLFGVYNHKVH